MQKKLDEPIHILNVAIRYDKKEEDDNYASVFGQFCVEKVNICSVFLYDYQHY